MTKNRLLVIWLICVEWSHVWWKRKVEIQVSSSFVRPTDHKKVFSITIGFIKDKERKCGVCVMSLGVSSPFLAKGLSLLLGSPTPLPCRTRPHQKEERPNHFAVPSGTGQKREAQGTLLSCLWFSLRSRLHECIFVRVYHHLSIVQLNYFSIWCRRLLSVVLDSSSNGRMKVCLIKFS